MSEVTIARTVDAKGLSCPLPIVRTKQAMDQVRAGEHVEVLATDPGSVKDFEAWARVTGNALVDQSAANGIYRFVLRHK